ncbi:MAG: 16S rRNA (cytidine(1402)-2'-O)-methyltransferase [Candidatus Vogelbacteria bacterium]|nr:16S rRNA (cytidine(1402)-2'-O)-methyltransferase [Candidatus Vogelbacteria bacterium]
MSKLFIVATPIGNLDDITHRAVETLKNVDVILCEDTRVTKRLLERYAISKPTLSYHSQSKLSKTDYIIDLLRKGKDLALVSDAGTPTISDPGVVLVEKIREVLGDEVTIIPIPGPSAFVAALSASGLPTHEFTFLGFLPHKKGRQTLFADIAESKRTTVFYESPHRFLKSLESLQVVLSPDRLIAVGRELTKIYEEIKVGTVSEILKYYSENGDKVRGEFVVIVSPK